MTAIHESDQLLERLLESPRLPFFARRIQDVLADEQAARRHFYETITEGDKVEYINGDIVYHSPVKLEHNQAGRLLLTLLSTYVTVHGLGFVGYEKILISLTRNDYEPDLCYFGPQKAAAFQPRQMRFPAPDFVVEILSESTEANDRTVKFEDYAAHGVAEYWIIDPAAETVEQYILAGEVYELLVKVNNGILQSRAVPGFDISVRAIFDESENVRALQGILVQNS